MSGGVSNRLALLLFKERIKGYIMKVMELTKELNAENNKEMIDFFKNNGYKVSSHLQNLTDEQIQFAKDNFVPVKKTEEKKETSPEEIFGEVKEIDNTIQEKPTKTFAPDDMIPCRSVTPWEVIAVGVDKQTVYHWGGYGDVDYVKFRDLQNLRRTAYITDPMIIIEDADLCKQWSRELGNAYKYFLNVEYPEEFFDLDDSKFEKLLTQAPDVFKEIIKTTAVNMIRNENYPTVQKINLIDNILGTCLKELL